MKILLATILLSVLLFSCKEQPKPVDLEKEKESILALHNLQRDYHFKKDSIAFVNQFSENFTSVGNGKINQPTKEESLKRFGGYFSYVEFIEWDDVSEPIISISDDASMAYTVVDKRVIVSYPKEGGGEIIDTTNYAWTTVYKKYDDEWKVDCVTSTNRPIE